MKRSDSLALIEIQERLIHDVHITNETAEILILVTETLLSSSREHIDLETAKNFTDDILRDGEDDCGSLNECNQIAESSSMTIWSMQQEALEWD